MIIVVDSNRIVAALLKDSTTRKILFNNKINFVAPEFVRTELNKYKLDFIKKLNITSDEYDMLISIIFENIEIIPKQEYYNQIDKLKSEISDKKDIPYLACAIATNSDGIWSHDPHLKEQNKIKILTNIDLLNYLKKRK